MGRLEAICHFLRRSFQDTLVGVLVFFSSSRFQLLVITGGIIHLPGIWPVHVSEVFCYHC